MLTRFVVLGLSTYVVLYRPLRLLASGYKPSYSTGTKIIRIWEFDSWKQA